MSTAATFAHQTTEGKGTTTSLGVADATQMSLQHGTLREAGADIHARVSRFLSAEPENEGVKRTQEQTKIALAVIDEALNTYEFDTLSISYNGGKDCLVLLVLYLSAIHTFFTSPTSKNSESEERQNTRSRGEFPTSIPSVYAKPPDPFQQVTTFVDTSAKDYHLDLTHVSTNPGTNPKYRSHTTAPAVSANNIATNAATPNGTVTQSVSTDKPIVTFRDAFALYLEANPKIKAIFVGTRRTDPHGEKLTHFDMTDGNWPRFMRIHPVIDWHLGDIWTFLKHPTLAVPTTGAPLKYCPIYDLGYTSLGGVGDTLRNPKLRYVDADGAEQYRPAFEMTEDRGERLGRE